MFVLSAVATVVVSARSPHAFGLRSPYAFAASDHTSGYVNYEDHGEGRGFGPPPGHHGRGDRGHSYNGGSLTSGGGGNTNPPPATT